MDNSDNQNQSRFLIAAVLSMVILFGWSYFFAPTPPANNNSNTAANSNAAVAEQTADATPAAATQPPVEINQVAQSPGVEAPHKELTIKSSLYEVKLDSKGAVASSWILYRNKSPKGDTEIFADGSTGADKAPLQLISEKALEPERRELPFRLSVGQGPVDLLINNKSYEVVGGEGLIELSAGESKTVEFVLRDQITWADTGQTEPVEVRKVFTFHADSYLSDLKVFMTRNGVPVTNAKLLIGASIGDHAINNHNFYHIESEAVASINDDIVRHQGNYSFTYDANGNAALSDNGSVNLAGVGDAYFAMAAIPASQSQGVEYRASKYDVNTRPFYEDIFQWVLRSAKTTETRHLVTVYLPIAADGSVTKIFTGTKDYFLLSSLSETLSAEVGRPVELTNLINFSNYWWLRWMTKPLSIPILYALNFFNGITHNYGVAIIVFTFLFYSLLFPLRWSQSKSFKKAAGNAPKMKEIQDKIKDLQKKGIPTDDPRMRELQMQQLRMTKDALPIGGCLPMLLQFPLLIAFYTAVTVSLEVRQASFLWLPDLSAADPWHLLEFAFAISMILSMKFTPQAATITPEQQMQQKMMIYLMPVMMLWVMWAAPSGLLLYWFFGNIVSFGQQMVINRMNKTNTPPGTELVDSVPASAKKVKPKLSTT